MRNVIYFIGLLSLVSCSSMKSLGVRVVGHVLEPSERILKSEGNYEFFKRALPSELQLLETLRESRKQDLTLNQLLVQGYASYGYGIAETDYLSEKWGEGTEINKKIAVDCYLKAIDIGVGYLEFEGLNSGIFWGDLDELEKNLKKKLALSLPEKKLLLYMGLSLASLANLNKERMDLVIHLPRAAILKKVACETKIENGVCDLFEAQLLGSRPKMLGGDPEQAKKILVEAKLNYPENDLLDWTDIELSNINLLDETDLDQKIKKLALKIEEREEARLSNLSENVKTRNEFSFFQAIASRKLEHLIKARKKIF